MLEAYIDMKTSFMSEGVILKYITNYNYVRIT